MKKNIFISILLLFVICIAFFPKADVSAFTCMQNNFPIAFSEIPDYVQERYKDSASDIFNDSSFPYPVLPISFTDEYTQYATEFRKQYPQRYISVLDWSWGIGSFINRIYCDSDDAWYYESDLYDTYDYAVYATNAIWCRTLFLDGSWTYTPANLDMVHTRIQWKDSTPKEVNCANGKKIYLITKVKNYTDTIRVTVSAWQFVEDKYAVVIGMYADVEKDSYNEQVKNYYETLATRLAEGTTVLQIPLNAADSEIDAMIAAVDTDSFSITVPDYVHYIPSTPKDPDKYHHRPSVDRSINYPKDLEPELPESSEDFGTSEEPSQEVSEEISDVTSDDVSAEESSYSPESTESVADTISAEESIESADSAVSADSTEDIDDENDNELTAVVITLGVIAVCGVLLYIIFKKKDNK